MKVQIFRHLTATMKTDKIPYVIFKPRVSFSLHHPSVSRHIKETFGQKEPIKVQFFRLLSALIKVHQILQPVLKPQSQGLFKFCITVQCHEK